MTASGARSLPALVDAGKKRGDAGTGKGSALPELQDEGFWKRDSCQLPPDPQVFGFQAFTSALSPQAPTELKELGIRAASSILCPAMQQDQPHTCTRTRWTHSQPFYPTDGEDLAPNWAERQHPAGQQQSSCLSFSPRHGSDRLSALLNHHVTPRAFPSAVTEQNLPFLQLLVFIQSEKSLGTAPSPSWCSQNTLLPTSLPSEG